MSKSFISHVRTNKGVFFHSINTKTDAITLHTADNAVILTYDGSCGVHDAKGKRLGSMKIQSYVAQRETWAFVDNDGNMMADTHNIDLLRAEVMYSKYYIENVYEG